MNNYDHIAPIYSIDMGANMTFDDITYYVQIANKNKGPTLELGCGTGRILSKLIDAGIDAIGIDASLPMLCHAKGECAPSTGLLQMDIRAIALRSHFKLVLMPYSLCTYLLSDSDWQRCADGIRAALTPGGHVLLDAFIPQPQSGDGHWRRDYARHSTTGWLVRHSRIQQCTGGTNIIERRYRLHGSFDGYTLQTKERIRPFSPEQLQVLGERYFGPLVQIDYDYQTDAIRNRNARFCTALFALK